jgi:hypothetical protein
MTTTKPGKDTEDRHSDTDAKRNAGDAAHHAPPHGLQKQQNKGFPGGGKQPKPMLVKGRSFRHQGR